GAFGRVSLGCGGTLKSTRRYSSFDTQTSAFNLLMTRHVGTRQPVLFQRKFSPPFSNSKNDARSPQWVVGGRKAWQEGDHVHDATRRVGSGRDNSTGRGAPAPRLNPRVIGVRKRKANSKVTRTVEQLEDPKIVTPNIVRPEDEQSTSPKSTGEQVWSLLAKEVPTTRKGAYSLSRENLEIPQRVLCNYSCMVQFAGI
ncbi:hypothetical protein CVT26_015192, partial [Gymnopilus dilepis]